MKRVDAPPMLTDVVYVKFSGFSVELGIEVSVNRYHLLLYADSGISKTVRTTPTPTLV
jgi:hypothetical protein